MGFFLTIFQILKYKSNLHLVLKVIYSFYLILLSWAKRPGVNWLRGETTQYLWLLIITNQRSNQFSLGCHSPFWELCPLKMLRIPKYFIFRWYLELNYFNNSHGWTVIDYSSFCNTDICGSYISFALHIGSVMVSMLASSVVNHEFDPQSSQTKTMKFVFVASQLSTQEKEQRLVTIGSE